jgi:hypothetical protein
MKPIHLRLTSRLAVLAALMIAIVAGCNQKNVETEASQTSAEAGHDHDEASHDLHGYWCVEHGIPEDICAQCNSKVAAEFQQKGDWCEEHNRPDSQCFICHPELEEKFASQYEAKFGEKPPKPVSE